MFFRKGFTFLCMIAVVLALAAFNFVVFSASSQIEERMRSMIMEMCRGEVQVGEMSFDVYEGLTVHDMVLRSESGGDVLLHVQEAVFKHKMSTIATGSPVLESIRIKGAVYVRRQGGVLEWGRIIPQFFADPRNRYARGLTLSVDDFDADLTLHLQDDLVFKDDEIQTFQAHVHVGRRADDPMQHVVTGSLDSSFWGEWTLGGALELRRDRYSSVEIENKAFPVDYQVKEKLVRRVQQVWENLKPRGMASIKGMARVRLQDINRSLDYQLEVLPRGGEMTYYSFPYPVSNLSGKIIVHKDGLKLRNLTGSNGDTQFQIHGQIHGFGRSAGVDLVIDAANVVLDDQFYQALNENTRKVYDRCKPSGLIDLKAHLLRPRGSDEKVPPDFNVLLKDASFNVEYFPYPIEHAKGVLRILPQRVIIKSVAAAQNGSWIRIGDSEIWTDDDPKKVACNLKVTADNLPIDDKFMAAFPPAYRKTFERFEPSGRVNVDAWVSRRIETGEMDFLAKVEPSAFAFKYELFPYPVECTGGGLIFRPGRTDMRDIEGYHGETRVALNGVVNSPKDGDLNVDIDVDFNQLVWEDDFLGALSPRLQTGLKKVNVTGPLDLQFHVEYDRPQGKAGTTRYDGDFEFNDNDVSFGLDFKELQGKLHFDGSILSQGGGFVMLGESDVDHVVVWDREFTDLKTEFAYSSERLEIHKIYGRNYGGKVGGNVEFDFGDETQGKKTTYKGGLRFTGMNVGLLSEDLRKRNPDARLAAAVHFEGDTSSPKTITGDGFVNMDDVNLWSVPFFSPLFNLLTLNDIADTKFRQADVYFTMADGAFDFNEMDFNSNSIDFVGDGTMKFDGDLDLNLRLAVAPKVLRAIPGLGALSTVLINEVLRAVVSADVKGNIRKPEVSIKALPAVTDLLKGMFSGSARDKHKTPEENSPQPEQK